MSKESNGKALGQAAFEIGTTFKEWEFDLNPLGDDDVEIRITHSGICHSDIHTVNGDWGEQKGCWPIVPGHEIVGVVTQIGKNVQRVQIGDRAGVGPQALSCLQCNNCSRHFENYCSTNVVFTYASKLPNEFVTKGGYATYNRTHQNFVVKVPAGLPSAPAAPLMCAGITTFAPLRQTGVKEGSRVGVIGIGGLGHLAIQFAAAMGAEVTAISSSPSKQAEALSFGAKHFLNTNNKEELVASASKFDVILNSSSGTIEWPLYLNLLAKFGTWVQLGLCKDNLSIPPSLLIMKGIRVMGSLIGSPSEIEDMLNFAAEKNVRPLIETAPLSDVNNAVQRVIDNKVRYRVVLIVDPEAQ